MQLAHVWDGDSGAGTQWTQGVLLKTPASGGAVDIGVSGQPLRIDPTGTTTQPVSGTVTVTQGTAANLNATGSGTVTANQGGTWNITNISGTVSLPTGAATSANQPSNAGAASTTSGQTGNLSMGAVTSAAPTYTTATTNYLSLTLAGALRVDGSSTTQPVSGTVTVAQATAANLNATVTGTVGATQSGTWTVQQGTPPWLVGGDIAAGSADSGNPAKIGGVARTANPTAVANGQRVNASFDKLGKQVVIGALRETKGDQKTSITTTTETTVVTAGGAGVFNDIYGIVVTNKSATTVFVDFRDSTGGAVVTTLAAPANDTRGLTLTVDSAIKIGRASCRERV